MNELALFMGIGGGLLGSKLLGWRTVCAVEINRYCIDVVMQRQCSKILEPFPIWGDICSFNGFEWQGIVDIVSGGFPCQPFSTANRGRVTAKDFWPEMFRVICEVQPRFVFAENVSEEAIKKAGEDLRTQGYSYRYTNLSSADVGADHIRERFWLLAYTDNYDELRSKVNAKTRLLQEFCEGLWKTNPKEYGVDDGFSSWVEQKRAIGNGQNPVCMAQAIHVLVNGI